MTQRLFCDTSEEFSNKLVEAEKLSTESNLPLFILFTGAVVAETGKSWCPDCVAADPIIEACLDGLMGSILLVCPVIREEYRNPEYLYRKHPVFKIACVPTFIKYGDGKVKYRLNDSQSQDQELVLELVNEL